MPVILLRHTRPDVAEGVCYGRSDLGLAADFETEAKRIATALPPVARIVSSPLGRCLRLAERIGAVRGLAVEQDARLAEMDFGSWEGQAWAAIARQNLDAWAADFHHARPHGGESVAMLQARVHAALDAAEVRSGFTLWVCHAGIARAVAALTGAADGWDTRLGFGEWMAVPHRLRRVSPRPFPPTDR